MRLLSISMVSQKNFLTANNNNNNYIGYYYTYNILIYYNNNRNNLPYFLHMYVCIYVLFCAILS